MNLFGAGITLAGTSIKIAAKTSSAIWQKCYAANSLTAPLSNACVRYAECLFFLHYGALDEDSYKRRTRLGHFSCKQVSRQR